MRLNEFNTWKMQVSVCTGVQGPRLYDVGYYLFVHTLTSHITVCLFYHYSTTLQPNHSLFKFQGTPILFPGPHVHAANVFLHRVIVRQRWKRRQIVAGKSFKKCQCGFN